MAQKIQTLFIDDIGGGDAEGTVRFGLDGTDYEIDLNAKHTEDLHNALANYVAHARKVGGTARRGAARGSRSGTALTDSWPCTRCGLAPHPFDSDGGQPSPQASKPAPARTDISKVAAIRLLPVGFTSTGSSENSVVAVHGPWCSPPDIRTPSRA